MVRWWSPMGEEGIDGSTSMNPCSLCLDRPSQISPHMGIMEAFIHSIKQKNPGPGHSPKQMTQNPWEGDPDPGMLLKLSRCFLHKTRVEYSFPNIELVLYLEHAV